MASENVPSASEVDAIKQQLRLLGHSLPTEVIVNFLQENNELLTAYQNPGYAPLPNKVNKQRSPTAPGRSILQADRQTARLDHDNTASFQSYQHAKQRLVPVAPQLDVTWASSAPDPSVISRSLQDTSICSSALNTDQRRCMAEGDAVRKDGLDQLQCTRDFLDETPPDHSHHPSALSNHLTNTSALEDNYHSLSSELNELAASLHQNSRCTSVYGQFKLDAQRRLPRTGAAPLGDQQQLQQVSHVGSIQTQYTRNAGLYSTELQYKPERSSSWSQDDSLRPYSHDLQDDQQDGEVDAGQKSQHSELQNDREGACHGNTQGESCGDRGGPKRSSRGYSPSPRPVSGCPSQRSSPVLNNSFIVPAQAAKPKKVDRVTRYRELQQVWNKDAFLRSGGTAKTSKRRGENFNELYAACHAAEDKLKGLTLKHGKAVKGPLKNGAQQENIAPTDKRRDALRWETRMRMQLRDDQY